MNRFIEFIKWEDLNYNEFSILQMKCLQIKFPVVLNAKEL